MSGEGKEIYYWDSCVFLAFLKAENHGSHAMEYIREQIAKFEANEIILATSAIGIMEILSFDLEESIRIKFESSIRRSNFLILEANESLARKAAKIRNHCYKSGKSKGNSNYIVSPPDALHVASGMVIDALKIITTDKNNKTGRRELGMTKIPEYYPISDLPSTPIEYPGDSTPEKLL